MADWQLGEIEVTSILEQVAEFMTLEEFFDGFTPEMFEANKDWLLPNVVSPTSGKIIPAYPILSGAHTPPYDPDRHLRWLPQEIQMGAGMERPPQRHLPSQSESGRCRSGGDRLRVLYPPARGSLRLEYATRKRPVRAHFSQRQVYLLQPEYAAAAETNSIVFRESVLPVMEAKQAELVAMDFALDDNISLSPTPGHTAGHVAIEMASNGVLGAMSGDLMHSPLQCLYPDLCPTVDLDPAMASATRQKFLEDHADRDKIVMTAHFPMPSVGRVVSQGDAFRFDYLEK